MAFTSGNDIWNGTSGDETVDGLAGNDTLRGNKGRDHIAGGAGLDLLYGGDDDDVLDGGTENDTLYGDAGNDIGYGGTGNDTLYGGIGYDYLFGGNDADKLFGGAGSDVMDGGEGADALYDTDNTATYGVLSADVDEMIGGDGNDSFFGGYDRMFGGAGNDSFAIKNKAIAIGGIGNDTFFVANTNASLGSWLEGGLGNDKITAGSGNDVLFSGYGVDTLIGGAGNDSYVITFDDFVDKTGGAGSGAKTITETQTGGVDTEYFIRDFKGDGRDDDAGSDGKEFDPLAADIDYVVTLDKWIENGVLDDQVYVNNPNVLTYFIAWLEGNDLNNNLKGSNLYDILDGGAGNDTISAGDGGDVIFAGTDADKIDGGSGEDIIGAWASYSLLNGLVTNVEDIDLLDIAGAATATGNAANNVLYGNYANNILVGNAGNDILDGWYYTNYYSPVANKITGTDTLRGGAGDDTYRIDEVTDVVDELTGNNNIITNGGTDTVQFKSATLVTSYTLKDGVENLTIVGNLKEAVGNDLNNRIIGDGLANILIGKFGDDYLDGGAGVDVFTGGYGDDTYVVSDVTETINENPGQGNDWAQSDKISLDLARDNWGGDVENGKLTGTSNLDLHGTTVNNRLLGNAGNNRLDGDGGIDTLIGGLGNDVYKVDTTNGTDTLLEEVNPQADASGNIKTGWIDSVESLVNYTLGANFENLSLLGAAIIGTGNSINNAMLGNDKVNTLYGLGGNDILNGGKGLDTLVGGLGDDTYQLYQDKETVTELASQGTDTIIVDYDVLSLVANIENLVLNADAALKGTGNSVNNVITGNGKNNTLMGLAGDDTLIAKEGLDVLTGGLGADVLNLTETLQVSDKVVIALGDSLADEVKTADRIVKFGLGQDTLDLAGTIKIAANVSSFDGDNAAIFKSHSIVNGIIRFDDSEVYSSPVSITASNLSDAVEYLKLNIKDGSLVAFQGTAPDPTTTSGSPVASTWVFQDNGAHDTLVGLVGVTTATSFSTAGFSSTSIHIA